MSVRMTKASCSVIARSVVIPQAKLKIQGDYNQLIRIGSVNLAFKLTMKQYYLMTLINKTVHVDVLTCVTFQQGRDVKRLCRQPYLLLGVLMKRSGIYNIKFFVKVSKNTIPL